MTSTDPIPPQFIANYPNFATGKLLSLRERMGIFTPMTGQGVTMAYIDAGFAPHPDNSQRIKLYVDASTKEIHESANVTKVDVMSWHGLMVSTVGSGNGALSSGYYSGIAPQSNLVFIRVTSPRNHIKEGDILRGFRWLVKNHKRYRIRVVNVSVGGDRMSNDPNHPLHVCVAKLVADGVTVVIASGNQGQLRIVPPASAPEAIVVGGYNDQNSAEVKDWVGYHSNYGTAYDGTPKPDVIALAEWVPSPILPETSVDKEARWIGDLIGQPSTGMQRLRHRGYQDLKLTRQQVYQQDKWLYDDLQNRIFAHKLINRYYQYVDGTSVAAPIVSGTVTLMLEANPDLGVEDIRAILTNTAKPLANIASEQQGAGIIQVDDAVKAALDAK
ncbi:MAG: S8 family serine peptidase [Chloroflexota bacterium]